MTEPGRFLELEFFLLKGTCGLNRFFSFGALPWLGQSIPHWLGDSLPLQLCFRNSAVSQVTSPLSVAHLGRLPCNFHAFTCGTQIFWVGDGRAVLDSNAGKQAKSIATATAFWDAARATNLLIPLPLDFHT